MNKSIWGVHADAVCIGVAATIRAAAATFKGSGETIENWVQFCIKAADEAHAEVLENPPTVTIASTHDPLMEGLLKMGDLMSEEDHAKHGATITHNAEEYAESGSISGYEGRAIVGRTRPMDGEDLIAAANTAAAMAFRCCMPQLTGRRRAQAYFACAAAGLQRGYFKGAEAKAMLHSAQLALNAFPKRLQNPRPAQRKVGFTQ